MKRLSLLVLASLGLSLAACGGGGGGGGDEEAFCDSLESLSDQIGDGALADDDDIEDALDAANELVESAEEGDQLDAATAVAEEIAGADVDDADDTADTVQDELGGFAEDCDLDEDEFAINPTTTTTEPEEETTTTTAPEDDTTTTFGDDTLPPDTIPGDTILVSAREPVPADLEAEFAGQADGCFAGDAATCDQLFAVTPPGSVAEAYGETCGGRIEPGTPGQCAAVIVAPSAPGTDIIDQTNAFDCFNGIMAACDTLFQQNDDGTPDREYGFFCGFRVLATDALCVDIFGDQAFF